MRAAFPLNKAGLSLPVTGKHLAAGFADSAAVGLQAIEDSEHIRVVVVLDQFLAVFDHVGMAGSALLFVALSEAWGRPPAEAAAALALNQASLRSGEAQSKRRTIEA